MMVKLGLAAIVVVGVIGVGGSYYASHGTVDTITTTVTDKHRITDRNGDSSWIVMTEDMSFENTDSYWHMKFNSTDLQGSLKIDSDYHITYYGWRVPFLSMYPNIISVEEMKK